MRGLGGALGAGKVGARRPPMRDDEELKAREERARRDEAEQLRRRDEQPARDDRDDPARARSEPATAARDADAARSGAAPSGTQRPAAGGWAVVKQVLTAVFVVLLASFKFLLAGLKYLKFALPALKSAGSMLVSIALYTVAYGWRFACGFVALIFIHECGHILMARRYGIPVSAPMFIPFMGAFVALKGRAPNAWVDAWIALAGPGLGGLGCLGCLAIGMETQQAVWYALAYSGFFINLINLLPVWQFDGAKVVQAISPWLTLVGMAIGVAFCIYAPRLPIMLIVILALSLPRIWNLLRGRAEHDAEYLTIGGGRRLVVALAYFGLAGLLGFGMARADAALHPA
jgi:Zn-dependent protease